MRCRILLLLLLALLLAAATPRSVQAQGLLIRDGVGTGLLTVDASKQARVTVTQSDANTYIISASTVATTALMTMSFNVTPGTKVRIQGYCVNGSSATSAVAMLFQIRRRYTPPTGGSPVDNGREQLTASTGTATGVATADGVQGTPVNARLGGGLSTAGASIESMSWQAGERGAGLADFPPNPPICKDYSAILGGRVMPRVVGAGGGGVANEIAGAVSFELSSSGLGGIAVGSISITIVVER